jgi:hypothetical protein
MGRSGEETAATVVMVRTLLKDSIDGPHGLVSISYPFLAAQLPAAVNLVEIV